MTIPELRNEIDRLDGLIIPALEERQRLVAEIQDLKEEQGLNARDENREQQIMDKIDELTDAHKDECRSVYATLFQNAGSGQETSD